MRGEFLAFFGEVESAANVIDAADQRSLRALDISPGRLIFASDELPVQRLGDGPLILGDCFPRFPVSGQSLSECWGNYVAFSAQGSSLGVERAALTGDRKRTRVNSSHYSAHRMP